jgi:hypothetical protein
MGGKSMQDLAYIVFVNSDSAPNPSHSAHMSKPYQEPEQSTPAFAYPVVAGQATSEGSQHPAPAPSTSQSQPQSLPPQSRQAAEDARKDRTLAEFMLMLDDYQPLVGLYRLPQY